MLSEVQRVIFTCDLLYIASLFLRTSILRTNARKNYATLEIYPRSCQATFSKTVALISTLLLTFYIAHIIPLTNSC